MADDWLEVYENCADRLNNNLRLNEISILTFSQFYFKLNRNQLEIVVKATYGLHPDKYFEILHVTFWGRSFATRRFDLQSNSRGANEIKGLPILIDFLHGGKYKTAFLQKLMLTKYGLFFPKFGQHINNIGKLIVWT